MGDTLEYSPRLSSQRQRLTPSDTARVQSGNIYNWCTNASPSEAPLLVYDSSAVEPVRSRSTGRPEVWKAAFRTDGYLSMGGLTARR